MNTVDIRVVALAEDDTIEGFVKFNVDLHQVLLAGHIQAGNLGHITHGFGPRLISTGWCGGTWGFGRVLWLSRCLVGCLLHLFGWWWWRLVLGLLGHVLRFGCLWWWFGCSWLVLGFGWCCWRWPVRWLLWWWWPLGWWWRSVCRSFGWWRWSIGPRGLLFGWRSLWDDNRPGLDSNRQWHWNWSSIRCRWGLGSSIAIINRRGLGSTIAVFFWRGF